MIIEEDYLFVYGTLMSSFDNEMSRYLSNHASYISQAFTHGKLYDLGEYPALISDHSATIVSGELYAYPADNISLLSILDEYEGYDAGNLVDSLYLRHKAVVWDAQDQQYSAWVYFYNQEVTGSICIPNGVYK